jgi:hypothetical protein
VARKGRTIYSDDGYFISGIRNNVWDATADKSITTYKAATGQVDAQTDVLGNVVTNHYDDFNHLKKVSTAGTPDVVTAVNRFNGVYATDCANDTHGLVEVFRTVTQQAGSSTVFKYMDNMGRLLRTKTFEFDGEHYAYQYQNRYPICFVALTFIKAKSIELALHISIAQFNLHCA